MPYAFTVINQAQVDVTDITALLACCVIAACIIFAVIVFFIARKLRRKTTSMIGFCIIIIHYGFIVCNYIKLNSKENIISINITC